MVFVILWVLFAIHVTGVSPGCTGGLQVPTTCTSKARTTYVDCSYTNSNPHRMEQLKRVPQILPTTYLNLTHNQISNITRESFDKCSMMKKLDLSFNNIKHIEQHSFDSFSRLSLLWLSNNSLDISSQQSLPDSLIQNLVRLIDLRINNNTYQKMEGYNENILENKTQLVGYLLDGIDDIQFPSIFGTLPKLRVLSIYGNLTHLRNSTFALMNGTKIHKLFIRSKLLKLIEPNALAPLKELKVLDLNYNHHLGLDESVYNGWYGLSKTIEVLSLQNLVDYKSANEYNVSEEFFPKQTQAPNLKELYLDINSISKLKGNWSERMPNLEKLSLSYNRFQPTESKFMNEISKLKNLTYLNMNKQRRYQPYDMSKGTEEIYITLPARLDTLLWYDSLNGLFGQLMQNMTFSGGAQNISVIDLSYNYVRNMVGSLKFLEEHRHMELLNMSHMSIQNLSVNFVGVFSNMTIHKLDISYNLIGNQLNQDRFGHTLKQFEDVHLKILDMTANGINYLYYMCFKNIHHLQELILRKNAIHIWEVEISSLQNLQRLDLSNNSISYLEQYPMRQITDRECKLDLSGNPFEVRCYALEFLKWLLSEKAELLNTENYIFYKGAKKMNTTYQNLTKTVQELNITCNSKTWVVATVSTISLMLILLFLSIIIYRHRWDIRYFILRLTTENKRYQALVNDEEHKYDAFVAFHQEDFSWVHHNLMNKLESGVPSFKLCIHNRDWLPGPTIEENVCQSIRSSRKTILVLSKNFVISNWCDFEMQMARMHSFDVGQETIVVLALEEIPLSAMSRTLINLRRTNTWLQWPDVEADREAFWELLIMALSHPGDMPVRCGCGRTYYPSGIEGGQ